MSVDLPGPARVKCYVYFTVSATHSPLVGPYPTVFNAVPNNQTVVFFSFGGFWATFGFINSPLQNIPGGYSAGAEDPAFNSGIAIWLLVS